MKLKSICKKFASIGLAAALVVSGITYQPNSAKAAAELPEVTVLGATLSLDAEAGKQSMRVAIQVTNANNASACGMDITYNGKKLTFSTENKEKGYDKLYDYDKENNVVVYAVRIKNIPAENFEDGFTISGFATPIDGNNGEDVTTAEPVEKSVDDVVDGIGKAMGGNVEIADDGSLVVVEEGFTIDLSKNKKLLNSAGGISHDPETGVVTGTGIEGFWISMDHTIPAGFSANITITGSKTSDAMLRAYFLGSDNSNDNATASGGKEGNTQMGELDFNKPGTYVLSKNSTHLMVKSTHQTTFESIEISEIKVDKIQKKLTANDIGDTVVAKGILAKINDVKGEATKKVNSDGTVTFTNNSAGFEGVFVPLGKKLAIGEKVTVRVEYSAVGSQARFYLTDGTNDFNMSNIAGPTAECVEGEMTVQAHASHVAEAVDNIFIKAKTNFGERFNSLTIKSVEIIFPQ